MFPSQKSAAPRTPGWPPAGFNGAGMFPSQKSSSAVSRSSTAAQLQWGRDVSIPEITIPIVMITGLEMLQWGRDVSIPEIIKGEWAKRGETMLQWGRDVSIPEITSPQPGRVPISRFNGAGMFPSQKCWRCWRWRYTWCCFNGAGMFPSQKLLDLALVPGLPSALQWGRDVSIPEMQPEVEREKRRNEASMGPGCFHPRKQ